MKMPWLHKNQAGAFYLEGQNVIDVTQKKGKEDKESSIKQARRK